jgi:hypothetical protein
MGALMSCPAKGAAMAIAIKISRQIRRILTKIAPMDQCGFAFIPPHKSSTTLRKIRKKVVN